MPVPDDAVIEYDGTITWLGVTLTVEQVHEMKSKGLNPWLTAITGQPVAARSAIRPVPQPMER